jgi:hypothetical protein
VQTGKADPVPIVMLDVPGGGYWKAWNRLVEEQLFGGGFISEDDRALYLITSDLDEAYAEIQGFYRRYHSVRYVDRRRTLVVRLREELRDEQVSDLNRNFSDILTQGVIRKCEAFPEEADESEIASLPRIALEFDQIHNGRLRQLIDTINGF